MWTILRNKIDEFVTRKYNRTLHCYLQLFCLTFSYYDLFLPILLRSSYIDFSKKKDTSQTDIDRKVYADKEEGKTTNRDVKAEGKLW